MSKRTAGRKPLRSTPMPRGSFTAFVEDHFFLMLLSDTGETSQGLRRAIKRLCAVDAEAAEMMKRARHLVAVARQELGEDAPQQDVYYHIRDNWTEFSKTA